jgi:hypothetical protein
MILRRQHCEGLVAGRALDPDVPDARAAVVDPSRTVGRLSDHRLGVCRRSGLDLRGRGHLDGRAYDILGAGLGLRGRPSNTDTTADEQTAEGSDQSDPMSLEPAD